MVAVLFLTLLFCFQSCAKKKDKAQNINADCKTCTALATEAKAEASAKVCSTDDEQAFRSQHSGQEIGCH